MRNVGDTRTGDIFVIANDVSTKNGEATPLLRGEKSDEIISLKTGLPVHSINWHDPVIILRPSERHEAKPEDKKARLLMIVVERMIARYQNQHAGNLDEEIFKLFETAKKVKFAETEADFQNALADL